MPFSDHRFLSISISVLFTEKGNIYCAFFEFGRYCFLSKAPMGIYCTMVSAGMIIFDPLVSNVSAASQDFLFPLRRQRDPFAELENINYLLRKQVGH